jgi:hypothetical protein
MLWVEKLTDSRTKTGMWVLCGRVFNWGNGELGEDELKSIYLLKNGWVGCLMFWSVCSFVWFVSGWVGSVLEDFGCALCWVLVRECVSCVCEFVKLPLN